MDIQILLVEDELIDCLAVKRMVAEEKLPYAITTAESTTEALKYLNKFTFDLALLDYHLPDGSGLEILAQAKDLPCIFLTGNESPQAAAEILKAGAYDYLFKDLDREYLKLLPLIISKTLERKKANKQIEIQQQMINHLSEIVLLLNENGVINYANNAIETILGYPPQAILGQHWSEVLISADVEQKEPLGWFSTLENDTLPALGSNDLKLRCLNGEVRCIAWTVTKQASGEVICVGRNITKRKKMEEALLHARVDLENRVTERTEALSGMVQRLEEEITSRKRIEEEQKKSVSLLQATLESTGDGILVVDNQGKWTGYNRQFIQIWNIPEEIIHQNNDILCLDYVSKQLKDPLSFLTKVKELYRQSEDICFDVLELNDGRMVDRYSQPQKIDGKSVGRVWCFQDNTQQRQQERELKSIAIVSNALRTAETKAQMLPVILEQTVDLLHAENACLELIDPVTGDSIIELGIGRWSDIKGIHIPSDQGLNKHIRDTGKPYLNNHVIDDPMILDPIYHLNCNAVAGAPMIAQDQLIGLLWIGRNFDFSDNDIRPLSAIADIAANAIRRANLFEQTEQRLKQLTALRHIDIAINDNQNLEKTLNVLIEQSLILLHVDAASVLILNSQEQILECYASKGFQTEALKTSRLKICDVLTDKTLRDKSSIYVSNQLISEISPRLQKIISGETFNSYFAVPLIAKGEIKGILQVFNKDKLIPDQEWINFLETLAGQATIAVDSTRLFFDLQQSNMDLQLAYDATIEGWSKALDLRDKETEGHSQRVTDQTLVLAVYMGINKQELVHIRRGALLHDIGKMGIPDRILLKPDKLTDEEWAIMRQHPENAHQLLSQIEYLRPALDIPLYHHEKWDGSGYPHGLKGEEIPLAARIFAVVDVWDALTSDRPYRKAWTKEQALKEIINNSGSHFDPRVVKAFIQTIKIEELILFSENRGIEESSPAVVQT